MTLPWPHKWFGFWRERGRSFERCPSVHAFVDASWEPAEPVLHYLTTAAVISATSWLAQPCVLCGFGTGSPCTRTDGEWYWCDDLAHYASAHHVRIPDELLASMRKRDFTPPTFTVAQILEIAKRLDRP